MKVKGRVNRVVLHGETVFVDGKVLAEPGFGQDIRLHPPLSPPSPMRRKHSSHQESPSKGPSPHGKERARHNSEPPGIRIGIETGVYYGLLLYIYY